MTTYTPRQEIITGASLSGSSGDTNRTYNLLYSDSVLPQFSVLVNNTQWHSTYDFTLSSGVITFVNAINDDNVIQLDYLTAETAAGAGAGITTAEKVVHRAGIGLHQIDENVGTGDNSETDFDLDHDKIIDGTLTLSYAVSGSNTFTDLEETTHYTVDYNSGRVVLTSAGVTALATKILYANYTYLDEDSPLTNDIIEDYITTAGERLREITGRVWSSTTFTSYLDGYRADTYPRTDQPYSTSRERWDYVQLDEYPVTSINSIWFLDRQSDTFSRARVYDSSAGTYTDEDEDAEDPETSFYPLNAVPASNDALYLGLGYKFTGIWTVLKTAGVDASTTLAITWEYYNGSAWTALSNVTAGTTGADEFTASGQVYWDYPSDWEETTVDGTETYWVRARLSAGSYSTVPIAMEVYPNTDRVISDIISVRNVQWTPEGRITFISKSIPEGVDNIRINYTAGVAATAKDYNLGVDLATCYAALQCVVAATGGSYDDETSFNLGSKSVTVGEVYVNVREVVNQLKEEIKEITALLGRRMDIAGN